MKKFAIIGVGGYIAPRHLEAIKETGNVVVAALDKNDSVGVLDSYFPDAHFFTEFERFDRHLEKLRQKCQEIDYVSICSPNYLHDAHIRFALRIGAHAICEKPLVINPWNIDALKAVEERNNRKVNTILQLRLHPSIIKLKEEIDKDDKMHEVNIRYITSRGRWYNESWKGNIEKSGGIVTNIGIHFFDILCWIFGKYNVNVVRGLDKDKACGYLEMDKAKVWWSLSLDYDDLPTPNKTSDKSTYRSIKVDGKEIEFSEGFKDLHYKSYVEILNGRGFGLDIAKPSIELASEIRNKEPVTWENDYYAHCS